VTDSLIATVYVADTVRIYPKTAQLARDLARVRALHDGEPGITSRTRDETKWVVAFNSPTDPGATYLYNRTTGRGTFLFRPRPWLKNRTLAGMTPVSYKAEDGLTVHGYLSTPPGVPARNLPLVLLVHGGPWARDTWGYQPEAQLLANRGYAVLQINYRGSTGYGKQFYNAGVHEFAGKMHTDLIDGVNWAVRQGIADPKKVGIYGGSYGGYATLVGLTFTPGVFACGVDYVGPSSLVTLIESFPPYWRPFLEGSFYRHVGDPSKPAEREELLKRSPITRVDSIRVPLLIAQGANDPRVTKRESDQIAIALRDRGVKVKYLVAPNEGHGFQNADNRLALYHSMELFFRDCLGGRAQETVPATIEQKIAQLTVNVDTLKLAAAAPAAPAVELKVGDTALNAARLTPGTTTLRLVLVQNGQERDIGTVTEELAATTVGGKPALLHVETINAPMMGGTAVDSSVFLRDGFTPVSHRSVNAQRTLALDFSGTKVTGSLTPKGGTAQAINYSGDAPLFDASIAGLLLRAAPLAEGYAVAIPAYIHEAGGKTSITARVTGAEQVDVGGRKVDAWVVEMNPAGRQVKQWVTKDTREVVRVSIIPQPGIEIRAVK
jgi:dienelactone hydrolase